MQIFLLILTASAKSLEYDSNENSPATEVHKVMVWPEPAQGSSHNYSFPRNSFSDNLGEVVDSRRFEKFNRVLSCLEEFNKKLRSSVKLCGMYNPEMVDYPSLWLAMYELFIGKDLSPDNCRQVLVVHKKDKPYEYNPLWNRREITKAPEILVEHIMRRINLISDLKDFPLGFFIETFVRWGPEDYEAWKLHVNKTEGFYRILLELYKKLFDRTYLSILSKMDTFSQGQNSSSFESIIDDLSILFMSRSFNFLYNDSDIHPSLLVSLLTLMLKIYFNSVFFEKSVNSSKVIHFREKDYIDILCLIFSKFLKFGNWTGMPSALESWKSMPIFLKRWKNTPLSFENLSDHNACDFDRDLIESKYKLAALLRQHRESLVGNSGLCTSGSN